MTWPARTCSRSPPGSPRARRSRTGGRAEEAEGRLRGLRGQAQSVGCPTVEAFAWFATGQAAIGHAVERARAAYQRGDDLRAAGASRLVTTVSRAALLGVAAEHDEVDEAAAAFRDVLDEWEDAAESAWTQGHGMTVGAAVAHLREALELR